MADWPPKKNTAFVVTFPIYDNDGDLVTAAAALDSEVSKDGLTFADTTNEAAEIATSSGVYTLSLTNTEMNADIVATITKTTTTNAKTAVNVMYTVTRQLLDMAFPNTSGRGMDVDASGGLEVGSFQAGALTAAAFAAGAIDAASIAANAIDAATFAADVDAELRSWLGLASGNLDTQLTAIDDAVDTEIASIVSSVATILAAVDTEVASIKAQTDQFVFTNANKVDAAILASADFVAAVREAIADSLMVRASSNWEATAPVQSLGTAVMKAVHRLRDNAGVLEIYRSNGTTVHAEQAVTTDPAAEPIDEMGGAATP